MELILRWLKSWYRCQAQASLRSQYPVLKCFIIQSPRFIPSVSKCMNALYLADTSFTLCINFDSKILYAFIVNYIYFNERDRKCS